jgi:uncharacterized protein YrrD
VLDTTHIVGLQVIGIHDGKLVGSVSQVVCDLASGEVIGLIVGTGAAEKGIMAEDVETIGEDAVMISSAAKAFRLSERPELMRRRREPSRKPLAVVTDEGKHLGYVSRIWIDPASRKVTRYQVSGGFLRDLAEGALILPIVPGTIHGEDTVVVPAAELLALAAHKKGLKAHLEDLSSRAREKMSAVREQAEHAAQSTRAQIGRAVEVVREQVASSAPGGVPPEGGGARAAGQEQPSGEESTPEAKVQEEQVQVREDSDTDVSYEQAPPDASSAESTESGSAGQDSAAYGEQDAENADC